jgi:hypothetical protein
LDLIEDLEEYRTLISLLLKIENQVKGFTFNTDKLEYDNLDKLLEEKAKRKRINNSDREKND